VTPTPTPRQLQLIERRRKTNATAQLRATKRITSILEIAELAKRRRSVYCRNSWGLIPAVVVMNMVACVVLREIESGRMYKYPPPPLNNP
jgi:hypothetical protein